MPLQKDSFCQRSNQSNGKKASERPMGGAQMSAAIYSIDCPLSFLFCSGGGGGIIWPDICIRSRCFCIGDIRQAGRRLSLPLSPFSPSERAEYQSAAALAPRVRIPLKPQMQSANEGRSEHCEPRNGEKDHGWMSCGGAGGQTRKSF